MSPCGSRLATPKKSRQTIVLFTDRMPWNFMSFGISAISSCSNPPRQTHWLYYLFKICISQGSGRKHLVPQTGSLRESSWKDYVNSKRRFFHTSVLSSWERKGTRTSVRKSPNRCRIFHQGNKYSNEDPILVFFLSFLSHISLAEAIGSWRARKPVDGSTVCHEQLGVEGDSREADEGCPAQLPYQICLLLKTPRPMAFGWSPTWSIQPLSLLSHHS